MRAKPQPRGTGRAARLPAPLPTASPPPTRTSPPPPLQQAPIDRQRLRAFVGSAPGPAGGARVAAAAFHALFDALAMFDAGDRKRSCERCRVLMSASDDLPPGVRLMAARMVASMNGPEAGVPMSTSGATTSLGVLRPLLTGVPLEREAHANIARTVAFLERSAP